VLVPALPVDSQSWPPAVPEGPAAVLAGHLRPLQHLVGGQQRSLTPD